MELLVMIYVRAIREGNFLLYIDALTKIVPWFFALGHTHYARWIPVHLHGCFEVYKPITFHLEYGHHGIHVPIVDNKLGNVCTLC